MLAASWGNHRWLLPCCWNASDGKSTSEVLQIAREVGILHGSVLNILHDHVGLSKVCEDGLHVFWRPFRSHFGWKRVQNCWLSTVLLRQHFVPYCNWRWTKNPPLGSCHQTAVDALEARQLIATQDLHSAVGWKSHGHNFLGLQRCAAGGLPST